MEDTDFERIEKNLLYQTRFIDFMLTEIRKNAKSLDEILGISYAKLIGIQNPYELAINSLRKVKTEIGEYLRIVRHQINEDIKREQRELGKRRNFKKDYK